jgi:signal transduction histidine kinase
VTQIVPSIPSNNGTGAGPTDANNGAETPAPLSRNAPGRQLPSLYGRLSLLVLVVLIPLLVVQAGIYAAWYVSSWVEQELATSDTACEAAATFEAYARDVHRQELAIGAALAGPHPYTTKEANDFLAASGKGYSAIRSWSWATPDGRIIASSQSAMVGLDVGDRTYFQAIRGGRPWLVSDLLADKVGGDPMFVIATRVERENGRLVGVAIASVNVTDLGNRAVALYHTVGEAIALFDSGGREVYNSQFQQSLFEDWRGFDTILTDAIESGKPRQGVLDLPAGGGSTETSFVARIPIGDTGWVAGARRPVAQAMAGVHSGLWIAGALNVLVAAVSGLLAWRTGGRLIGQFRRLESHAQAIGQGDYTHIADRTGVRELSELADAFNHMQRLVQQRTRELQSANLQLQAVFDVANVGMLLIDGRGVVQRVNRTVSRWFEKDLSMCVGGQPGNIIGCVRAIADPTGCGSSPECQDCRMRRGFESVLQTGQPVHDVETEIVLSTAGRENRLWLEISADPVALEGKPHVIVAMNNVTLRKQAEESLKRAAEQLTRSNRELEQFAYVASHDLQEPLRVVTGYVQLIDRKYKGRLDATADEFFAFIVDGVARMQQLITDLLNYSRVGTHGAPFRPVDMQAVLDRVLANLKVVTEEHGAVVTHDPLPIVLGDETQLVQLFQNLIGNGVKFRSDQTPQIHVSARRNEDRWELTVRDNGIGIERQYWDQIFVIFQRLHTRQKYPGTGIGLAICKRIVERHNGRIWIDSEPGQGAAFHFTLPQTQEGLS